jgi:hypothetical protein
MHHVCNTHIVHTQAHLSRPSMKKTGSNLIVRHIDKYSFRCRQERKYNNQLETCT